MSGWERGHSVAGWIPDAGGGLGPGFPALTKAPTRQKAPGQSVGDTFFHKNNQRDGNEHFMGTRHVLKGTGWRLAALGASKDR